SITETPTVTQCNFSSRWRDCGIRVVSCTHVTASTATMLHAPVSSSPRKCRVPTRLPRARPLAAESWARPRAHEPRRTTLGCAYWSAYSGSRRRGGLTVRTDWGPQDTAHAFGAELRWLGIQHSPSFVGEPQCHGVIERSLRSAGP